MSATRVLVPVTESVTLRSTVAHAVRETHDRATDAGHTAEIHFVYPLSERRPLSEEAGAARELLDRVRVWAHEDLGADADAVVVETELLASGEYLFGPADYAAAIERYVRRESIEAVILDPEYAPVGTTPLLPPIAAELRERGIDVREAPVRRERRRIRLVRRGTVEQLAALFVVSFGFYLLLAWSLDAFELATGAIAAGVVAVALWQVSFTGSVDPARTGTNLLRLLVYVPFLLWEITKANLEIAYVVLHPDLPIDPGMVEFDAAVWSPVPATTLANSITLTPGTLTVEVTQRHFTVHTLTEGARLELLDGGLERAVRFVFYGRSAAHIASPAERGEGEIRGADVDTGADAGETDDDVDDVDDDEDPDGGDRA